jgi:hypothetical protein
LNNWEYKLGEEILVPSGRKELFDSGVLHYYNYGQLYNSSTKLLARATSENRVMKSAENFMAGFFGLDWTNSANLEIITEGLGYNNSLAGFYGCSNTFSSVIEPAFVALEKWKAMYLKEITKRLQKLVEGYTWTASDTYAAQELCPYETVGLGYSSFCQLFTMADWKNFEYTMDIEYQAIFGFLNPTGRAQGIAWVEEFLGRIEHHLPDVTGTDANSTLDDSTATFPVKQSLYFDFAHDASIVAVLTAFGLKQFAQALPVTGPPKNQRFFTSRTVPFAGRLNIEIIKAPHPVSAKRPSLTSTSDVYNTTGGDTWYVHFLQNQRTLPLGKSFPKCGDRDDGWCELKTFLEVQKGSLAEANFDYACTGNYSAVAYGNITNGAPLN